MDLLRRAEELSERDPDGFYNHRDYKFFDDVFKCIRDRIRTDPGNKDFNLGNTLGKKYKNWRRAKKGLPNRYRLFFQYSSQSMDIILAWLNDESSIRRAGHKKDVYNVFVKMLEAGSVPASYDELVEKSTEAIAIEQLVEESTDVAAIEDVIQNVS